MPERPFHNEDEPADRQRQSAKHVGTGQESRDAKDRPGHNAQRPVGITQIAHEGHSHLPGENLKMVDFENPRTPAILSPISGARV